jgi:hypothetical protein
MNTRIKLTVFFEGAFWVGVFERTCEEKYEISKVIFGSEPKDYEVYDFILKNFYTLRFSNSLSLDEIDKANEKRINPKRLQKEIKKETENRGVGTKAQLAMKLQYETSKVERKKTSREEKEAEKERKFVLRQQKKFMKHKGH